MIDFSAAVLHCGEGEFVRLSANSPASLDLPVIPSGGDHAVAAKVTVWNGIPEPTAAGLGLVGMVLWLLGRRR